MDRSVTYTQWITDKFDFVGSVRVLESHGELMVILRFEERELNLKKVFDDIWSIYTSSLVYDPNLHVDCFYIIHKMKEKLKNFVCHVYTVDLYNFYHNIISYEELDTKAIYLEVG